MSARSGASSASARTNSSAATPPPATTTLGRAGRPADWLAGPVATLMLTTPLSGSHTNWASGQARKRARGFPHPPGSQEIFGNLEALKMSGGLGWHCRRGPLSCVRRPRDSQQQRRSNARRTDGEQAQDQGQRSRAQRDREPRHTTSVRAAQRAAPARPALRLRPRAVRRLLGAARRQGNSLVRDPRRRCQWQGDHDARGHARPVGNARAARPLRHPPRCIRCSRRGSMFRFRTAVTVRTE